MKKTLVLLWFVAAALATPAARGQSNIVFAVNYGQPTTSFGTINLTSGSFSKIASLGATNINDIAWCPTNGLLYGISNQSVLVTINQTNGAITTVATLTKSVQSLAFRPSDGALFGATATKLFTIDPVTGKTIPVGDYGSITNLMNNNHGGQNIRFAQDGNLYVSNTSTNTDIYQINTTTGTATWMGEAVGCPNAVLENSGANLYGVSQTNNASAELVSFNLNSFVAGGTNADGSTHQITWGSTGAGTNFPPNFVFSGSNPSSYPAPQLCCACTWNYGTSQCIVKWRSVATQSYQLLCKTNLAGAWTPMGSCVAGTGAWCAVTNNMNGVPQCFFRLALE